MVSIAPSAGGFVDRDTLFRGGPVDLSPRSSFCDPSGNSGASLRFFDQVTSEIDDVSPRQKPRLSPST